MRTLTAAAVGVLETAEPAGKIAGTHSAVALWRQDTICEIGATTPPTRPARPERPLLSHARDMPKRSASGSRENRVALLHALAHIELNAIDLAWDLIARFGSADLPRAFFDDWTTVAEEEATHHGLLAERMRELGARYGDLPAHDGLWEAAAATSGDLLARLAVVPLVLEARGLDVTPSMIERLDAAGDTASAAILRVIYRDEVKHVAAGARWFAWEATRRGVALVETYQALVRQYFRTALKPPFNAVAREAAGFPAAFYAPLAASDS
jgi:uncharacterized ferritin-like protein (DUF455 family)